MFAHCVRKRRRSTSVIGRATWCGAQQCAHVQSDRVGRDVGQQMQRRNIKKKKAKKRAVSKSEEVRGFRTLDRIISPS